MTTNGTVPRPSSVSGPILNEAARRMLPVIAGRLLAAVVDRAVEKVDDLADRLGERSGTSPQRDEPSGSSGSSASSASSGRAGAAGAFLLEQARLFLAFVVRIAMQALEALRRATEQLRARRAPEGIDEAPSPEEVLEDTDEDTDEDDLDDDDDLDDEYDEYDEDEDEDVEARATADA
ncbi:hypothetical protein [Actinomycetospora lemnae]|uniref:Uncharacterized protein n=1 Tax=Actinomycetospora lemnae TaxID=3019891 RepID=A0ABT5T009_9PSEU|nr:hypothetical protein [Actinomycetospora sp. DW7H6]MDD7968456.1 hypothetical protein [Actinomycetospora sp. DW7H6]